MSLEQPILIQQHPQQDTDSPAIQSFSSASLSIGTVTLMDTATTPPGLNGSSNSETANDDEEAEIDPQIIEALKSKDRIYVLKLGEVMESLIRDGRMRADLTPATSYQRLLVHRCSAYYGLTPENDPVTKGISVRATGDSRIPFRRICELVPAEQISQPAFQIMRRSQLAKSHSSRAGSDAGDLSDSETGSMTSSKRKNNRTIEEREAAYNEARSRIFMNFDQKEKDSASSSTLSLPSTRDSGSVDDDSVGTPATESEQSGPAASTKEKKRGGSSVGSSRRSMRSSAASSHDHDNARGSGAVSPSPSYPPVYDAPHHGYADPAVHAPYTTTYYYYPHPGYIPPVYGYYPPYQPYVHSQPSMEPPPTNGSAGEVYVPPPAPPPPQQYAYPPASYMWPPPLPPPHHTPSPHPVSSPASPGPPPHPHHQNGFAHPSYMHTPPAYGYPIHPQTYYTPPMMSSPELAPMHMTPYNEEPARHLWDPNGPNSRDSTYRQRKGGGSYSYGPGISQHSDVVGPRMGGTPRRTSNRSVNGDEESIASSSSSQSSRRTYTSTTSSANHHPLPPRPDWAVGLRPQPTLHSSRHHSHNHNQDGQRSGVGTPPRNSSSGFNPNANFIPSANGNGNGNGHGGRKQSQSPPVPTDFPPLSSAAAAIEKRPTPSGAWTNPALSRSILKPPGEAYERQLNSRGSAELYDPKQQTRMEEGMVDRMQSMSLNEQSG